MLSFKCYWPLNEISSQWREKNKLKDEKKGKKRRQRPVTPPNTERARFRTNKIKKQTNKKTKHKSRWSIEVGCLAPACYAKIKLWHLVVRTLCYDNNVQGNRKTNTSGQRKRKKKQATQVRKLRWAGGVKGHLWLTWTPPSIHQPAIVKLRMWCGWPQNASWEKTYLAGWQQQWPTSLWHVTIISIIVFFLAVWGIVFVSFLHCGGVVFFW